MLNLENQQTLIEVSKPLIEKLEEALDVVATGEGVEYEAEADLLLVTDEAIREVNRIHRGKDAVTDVLSFPTLAFGPGKVFAETYREADLTDDLFLEDSLLLGDVLISTQRAQEQADEFGHSLEREIVFLFVHSLLHLLGYDHLKDQERERMTEKERHYMAQLGVSR